MDECEYGNWTPFNHKITIEVIYIYIWISNLYALCSGNPITFPKSLTCKVPPKKKKNSQCSKVWNYVSQLRIPGLKAKKLREIGTNQVLKLVLQLTSIRTIFTVQIGVAVENCEYEKNENELRKENHNQKIKQCDFFFFESSLCILRLSFPFLFTSFFFFFFFFNKSFGLYWNYIYGLSSQISINQKFGLSSFFFFFYKINCYCA